MQSINILVYRTDGSFVGGTTVDVTEDMRTIFDALQANPYTRDHFSEDTLLQIHRTTDKSDFQPRTRQAKQEIEPDHRLYVLVSDGKIF